ncbi:hypothetical protein [Devosia sp.]|uniref:hypothetical protein n=1 Tax=Devosia sp. TaxID=1871048 RepID=UPI003BA8F886
MSKYWFARRFPLTEPKATRMGAVSTEGKMVVTLFAGALLAGAVGLFLFSFGYREPFIGIVTFFGFAIVGTAVYLVAVARKGDTQHTVDEYKSGRVRQP